MNTLGEIKTGKEIGRGNKSDKYHKFVWQACENCGEERWVAVRHGKPIRTMCLKCACKNKIISEETREKYRQSGKRKLGTHWSEESKNKIRGENNCKWKGGRHITVRGYVEIAISPDSPYYPMSFHGRIKEHRLFMAQHLGRCLSPWEIVHHNNGNRQDNRIDNLFLEIVNVHNQITRVNRLERQVKALKEQIKALKSKT